MHTDKNNTYDAASDLFEPKSQRNTYNIMYKRKFCSFASYKHHDITDDTYRNNNGACLVAHVQNNLTNTAIYYTSVVEPKQNMFSNSAVH